MKVKNELEQLREKSYELNEVRNDLHAESRVLENLLSKAQDRVWVKLDEINALKFKIDKKTRQSKVVSEYHQIILDRMDDCQSKPNGVLDKEVHQMD